MGKLTALRPSDISHRDEYALINNWVEHFRASYDKSQEAETLAWMIESGVYDEGTAQMFPHGEFMAAVLICVPELMGIDEILAYIRQHSLKEAVLKGARDNRGYCCLICNGDNLDAQMFKSYLATLKRDIERGDNCFIVAGIGGICHGLQQVSHSFRNALDAIRLGVCEDESCIFEYSANLKTTCKIYFPVDFDERMSDILVTGSEEMIANALAGVFDQNKALPRIYMRMIYSEFINTYMRIADKYGQEHKIAEVLQYVENEYRPSHVMRFLTDLFRSLLPAIGIPQDTAKRVECFICEYIEKNYHDENISIEGIAEKLRLSGSYVSTLFKRSAGIAFSQYLVEFRINKAKELLMETDYSIKAISAKVGYGTYNSFIRSFSKIAGVTPVQFRSISAQRK
jgi:AraC-like DNA-binding protein